MTVVDTLPGGLTATGLTGTGWTCTLGDVSCTRSDALAAGASYPAITLTVNVAANAPISTNTATVSGGGDVNSSEQQRVRCDDHRRRTRPDDHQDRTRATSPRARPARPTRSPSPTLETVRPTGTVTVTDTLPAGLTATALQAERLDVHPLPALTCTHSGASPPAPARQRSR